MKTVRCLLLLVGLILARSAFPAGGTDLAIPASVKWIYVFLQSPNSTGRGSGKDIDMMSPEDFLKNFGRYQQMARKEKMKLVVAASTSDNQWMQDQILYKGSKLEVTSYYNPGTDRMHPGAEIPLD